MSHVGTKHLTIEQRHDLLLRAMAAVANVEMHDNLWWRTDGEYAPITLFVNCNDLFYWACADCEEITADNVTLLEQTCAEVKALPTEGEIAVREYPTIYATELFVCRSRKMRPQRPALRNMPKNMISLFEACGPERDPKTEG